MDHACRDTSILGPAALPQKTALTWPWAMRCASSSMMVVTGRRNTTTAVMLSSEPLLRAASTRHRPTPSVSPGIQTTHRSVTGLCKAYTKVIKQISVTHNKRRQNNLLCKLILLINLTSYS